MPAVLAVIDDQNVILLNSTYVRVLSVSHFYPDFTEIYVRCFRHRVCVIHIIRYRLYRIVIHSKEMIEVGKK